MMPDYRGDAALMPRTARYAGIRKIERHDATDVAMPPRLHAAAASA